MVKTFINRFFKQKKAVNNRYEYGYKNSLPQDLIKLLGDNATARRAANKRATYIEANGFTDESLNSFEVYPGISAQSLLKSTAQTTSIFEGFSWLIFRNPQGKIAGVKSIPFKNIRKTSDDEVFEYNHTYSIGNYTESERLYYPKFQGVEINSARIKEISQKFGELNRDKSNKYPGEILYMFETNEQNDIYPIPVWYSGEEDIKTGAVLARVDRDYSRNSFQGSLIITTVGILDDTKKGDDGRTDAERMEENIKQFSERSGDDSEDGQSGVGKVMWHEVETPEQKPQIDSINVKGVIESSILKRDSIDRINCRSFSVHPVLLGFDDGSVLGNQQALANASNELCNDVKSIQSMIERTFELVWPGNKWTITKFTPILFIPDKLIDVLTQDEKRALIGYEPLKKEVVSE